MTEPPIDWTVRNTPLGVMPYRQPPPPPRRKRRVGLIVGLAAALVVLLAGGTVLAVALMRHPAPTTSAAHPAPTDTYIGPGTFAAADDQKACTLNEQMRDAAGGADLTGQGGTITQIQALAGKSSNFDIRFDANMLKDRYDLAAAARRTGGTDAFSMTTELFTASLHLSTDCLKAGYRG